MGLELEIQKTKQEISQIKKDILSLKGDIDRLGGEKNRATQDSLLGVAMMGNDTTKAYGVLSYTSNSAKSVGISSEISNLEYKKRALEQELGELEMKLKSLEEEFEYESRPEVSLIVTDKEIFIAGDENKRNILSGLEEEVSLYIDDYNQVVNSPDVAKYQKLNGEILNFVKSAKLPEATDENMRRLDIITRRHEVPFEYVVIDGKIVVDRDFVSPVVAEENRSIERFEDMLVNNNIKRDKFEPTALGKVFKSVRKKQQSKYEAGIKEEDSKYKTIISGIDSKIQELETVKEMFIEPSLPIMDKVYEVINLCGSKHVKTFVYELEDIEKNINSHTILKNTVKYDVISKVVDDVRSYLDAKHVKLSREQLINAISNSVYNGNLKTEIMNQMNMQSDVRQQEQVGNQKTEQMQYSNAKQL